MRRFIGWLFGFAVVAVAHSADVEQMLASADEAVARVQIVTAEMRGMPHYRLLDFRRRTEMQDFDEWAFPPRRLDRVHALVNAARKSAPDRAEPALREALRLIASGEAVMNQISDYWLNAPTIPLAPFWAAFTSANGHTLPLDAELLAMEVQLSRILRDGDFVQATGLARRFNSRMNTIIEQATREFTALAKNAPHEFRSRTTPCPVNTLRNDRSVVRMKAAANPDDFFPPRSRRQGERGRVVVRARVSPSNCASAVALIVRSGFPDRDAAALKVAEASLYLAPVEGGEPREGEISFVVDFVSRKDLPQ